MVNKNSKSLTFKVGYTEAEIRARAVSTDSHVWRIHCLNATAHQHADRNPSAYYFTESGYYGCHVCGLNGYANDRNRADWTQPQKRTYSNGVKVIREPKANGEKKIWQENTTARSYPFPYSYELIHDDLNTIYIVEGEPCVESLAPFLDTKTQAVVTSIGGSNAAHKTNWSPIRKMIDRGCQIVFIPDLDTPGEHYIHRVAEQLHLDNISVIRLCDLRDDGYDIADWLKEGHTIPDLPPPSEEPVSVPNRRQAQPFRNLFGYHKPERLEWLSNDMIPARKLTLLFGRAKIGKSAMSLYIASMVSKQLSPFTYAPLISPGPFFDQQHKVLIYSSEDDWDDAIAVRLQMMGANMTNIAPLRNQQDWTQSFNWDIENSSDYQLLLEGLRQDPVSLLVIDPLIDIITGANNNDAATIRRAMEQKIQPIVNLGVTVLGIHHERKGARPDDLLADRALGSQAWPAAARSVLYMQALPKRIALGGRSNTANPRATLDNRYNVSMRDLGTNSYIMGIITASDANYAHVDGGYHYELPTAIPEGQSSSFISVAINEKKITSQTPSALVECYNPMRKEEIESSVNKKARIEMAKEIRAVKAGEQAIHEWFENNQSQVPSTTLLTFVQETASIGRANAKEAIRNKTKAKRDGNSFFRILKTPKK